MLQSIKMQYSRYPTRTTVPVLLCVRMQDTGFYVLLYYRHHVHHKKSMNNYVQADTTTVQFDNQCHLLQLSTHSFITTIVIIIYNCSDSWTNCDKL